MKTTAMAAEERVHYMTQAPVRRLILEMSAPTVISMLVTSFYNMADTLFVGQLDTQSTAAVGVAYSAMALLQATSFFFGHGSGNYISRQLGARNYEAAERMAATGFFSALLGRLRHRSAGRGVHYADLPAAGLYANNFALHGRLPAGHLSGCAVSDRSVRAQQPDAVSGQCLHFDGRHHDRRSAQRCA